MSYMEAREDGIPITKNGRGMTVYHPNCRYCGHPLNSWNYIRGMKYACRECRRIAADLERTEKALAAFDSKAHPFNSRPKECT